MSLRVLDQQPLAAGTHFTAEVDGRPVEIWEPADSNSGARPLLLAHDGQNLFLPGRSFGGVPWALSEAISSLPAHAVQPFVIAPWNRADIGRAADYAPQRILQSCPDVERGFTEYFNWTEHVTAGNSIQWSGDAYVQWCADQLIPSVQSEFGWQVNSQAIAVMGSSMGGLASAYALALEPDLYSTALCLSTHWLPGGHELARKLTSMLPAADSGARIWFDHGTLNLDSTYGAFQRTADEVMHQRGYRKPNQWCTKVYADADHNETSWSVRLPEILRWWLLNGHEQ